MRSTQKRKRCNSSGEPRPRWSTTAPAGTNRAKPPNTIDAQIATAVPSPGDCNARSSASAGWSLKHAHAKPSTNTHSTTSNTKAINGIRARKRASSTTRGYGVESGHLARLGSSGHFNQR